MREFPDVVRIEPTGACNLSCRHCPTGLYGSGRGSMSLGAFARYMSSLPRLPRVLVLYHGGEPLINPRLGAMIRYAASIGVERIVLNTNGVLLGYANLPGLSEVRVSIDGATEAEYGRIRPGSGIDDIARGVRQFKSDHPHTRIVVYNVRARSDGTTPEFIRTRFEADEYRNEPARVWAALVRNPAPARDVRYCPNLFETFTILSTGDVVQCCEDITGADVVGNLDDDNALSIWRYMEQRRYDFEHGRYNRLCQACHIVTGEYL